MWIPFHITISGKTPANLLPSPFLHFLLMRNQKKCSSEYVSSRNAAEPYTVMGKTHPSGPNQKIWPPGPFCSWRCSVFSLPLFPIGIPQTGRGISNAGAMQESLPGATGLFSVVLVTMASEQQETNTEHQERKCFYFPCPSLETNTSHVLYLLFLLLRNISIKKLSRQSYFIHWFK